VVNVTWADFIWFILTFHLLYHSWRRFKWCWRCCDATVGSLFATSSLCLLICAVVLLHCTILLL
jgi:hypothetical protein